MRGRENSENDNGITTLSQRNASIQSAPRVGNLWNPKRREDSKVEGEFD
jgi:hypothetical protein